MHQTERLLKYPKRMSRQIKKLCFSTITELFRKSNTVIHVKFISHHVLATAIHAITVLRDLTIIVPGLEHVLEVEIIGTSLCLSR